jgi:hypothetical protein
MAPKARQFRHRARNGGQALERAIHLRSTLRTPRRPNIGRLSKARASLEIKNGSGTTLSALGLLRMPVRAIALHCPQFLSQQSNQCHT